MKNLRFLSFRFNFKWPRFKNLHFKNRFSKTFPLNTSVISGWSEILIYFVLITIGIFLFYSWNQIQDTEYWIEIDQINEGKVTELDVAYDIELNLIARFNSKESTGLICSPSYTTVSNYEDKISKGDTLPYQRSGVRLYDRMSFNEICRDTLVHVAEGDSQFMDIACKGICTYFYLKIKHSHLPHTHYFYHVIDGVRDSSYYDIGMGNLLFDFVDDDYTINYARLAVYDSWTSARLSPFNPSVEVKRSNYFSLYDLSCSNYKILLKTSYGDSINLKINFDGCANFSRMYPEPDEVGYNYILFSDQNKIKIIRSKGLKFFTTFPELQNKQYVRSFALTAILSIFATTLLAFLLNAIFASLSLSRKGKEESDGKSTDPHNS